MDSNEYHIQPDSSAEHNDQNEQNGQNPNSNNNDQSAQNDQNGAQNANSNPQNDQNSFSNNNDQNNKQPFNPVNPDNYNVDAKDAAEKISGGNINDFLGTLGMDYSNLNNFDASNFDMNNLLSNIYSSNPQFPTNLFESILNNNPNNVNANDKHLLKKNIIIRTIEKTNSSSMIHADDSLLIRDCLKKSSLILDNIIDYKIPNFSYKVIPEVKMADHVIDTVIDMADPLASQRVDQLKKSFDSFGQMFSDMNPFGDDSDDDDDDNNPNPDMFMQVGMKLGDFSKIFNLSPDEGSAGVSENIFSTIQSLDFANKFSKQLNTLFSSNDGGIVLSDSSSIYFETNSINTFAEKNNLSKKLLYQYITTRELAISRLYNKHHWIKNYLIDLLQQHAKSSKAGMLDLGSDGDSQIFDSDNPYDDSPEVVARQAIGIMFSPTDQQQDIMYKIQIIISLINSWAENVTLQCLLPLDEKYIDIQNAVVRRYLTVADSPIAGLISLSAEYDSPILQLYKFLDFWRTISYYDKSKTDGLKYEELIWENPDFFPTYEDLDDVKSYINCLDKNSTDTYDNLNDFLDGILA
ncbi:MAG: zinc-dependent metalloprotease [Bifidobacteriaceae bacterium]|jgi:uncharacterized protein (DUF2342 family)|nr:zinc-dependent metalloprotease [Bifidobacteriaceae bacterium]